MKKVVIITIAIIIAVIAVGYTIYNPVQANNYETREAVIVNVDGNTIECMTEDNQVWKAYNGYGFKVGEHVNVVFDTLGDDNIYNDEIVNVVGM